MGVVKDWRACDSWPPMDGRSAGIAYWWFVENMSYSLNSLEGGL